MGNATLFDLMKELYEINEALEQSEGELTPELDELLTINRSEMKEKFDKYHSLDKALTSDNQHIAEQVALLELKKKRNVALQARLKKYVIDATKLYGKKNYVKKSGNITYNFDAESVKTNVSRSYSMVVTNEKQVPEFYKARTYSVIDMTEEDKKWFEMVWDLYKSDPFIIKENVSVDNKLLKENMILCEKHRDMLILRLQEDALTEEEKEVIQNELHQLESEKPKYAQLIESWNVRYTV